MTERAILDVHDAFIAILRTVNSEVDVYYSDVRR